MNTVLVGGSVEIPILQVIVPSDRLRPCSEEQVKILMESIAEVGLINPITVFAERASDGILFGNGYLLVAGLNRLEACRRLGRETIPAVLLAIGDLHRQLIEVDENLCGSKLTPAERSLFTRRRKQIYIALHPETRAGVAGGKAGGKGRPKMDRACAADDSNPQIADCFAENTAKATGQSRDTIERDAARGEALGDEVLTDVRGTSLDSGVELDALKAMPPAERAPLVERAKAGERVSARREKTADQLDEEAALEAFADALASHFQRREHPLLLDWCQTLKMTRLRKRLEEIGVGSTADKTGKKGARAKSSGSGGKS
ncbi:ParB family transcriptional regulator, chromosome partitioning protein [uncultured Gammaproteobacteria bacterium]